MAVIIRSVESLDELGDVFDAAGAQFDPPINRSDVQRFGDLRAALEAGERDLLLVAESDGTFAGAAVGRIGGGCCRGFHHRGFSLSRDFGPAPHVRPWRLPRRTSLLVRARAHGATEAGTRSEPPAPVHLILHCIVQGI